MRALVTGGAGFIGSHLAERLLMEGQEVLVIDDFSNGIRKNLPEKCPLAEGDLCDAGFVREAVRRFLPDAVFHLAAQTSVVKSTDAPGHDARVNLGGMLVLLEALRTSAPGAKVIFTSTGGALYGGGNGRPFAEKDPVAPLSGYGISKLTAEEYLRVYRGTHGLRHTSLRLGNVYGPRQRSDLEAGVVSILSEKLSRGERPVLYGFGKASRDYVQVEDVVEALVLSLGDPADGLALNVGTGVATPVIRVYELIREALGAGGVEPELAPLRPGEVSHIALDSRRIAETLGWKPRVDLETGISGFVEWFRRK